MNKREVIETISEYWAEMAFEWFKAMIPFWVLFGMIWAFTGAPESFVSSVITYLVGALILATISLIQKKKRKNQYESK